MLQSQIPNITIIVPEEKSVEPHYLIRIDVGYGDGDGSDQVDTAKFDLNGNVIPSQSVPSIEALTEHYGHAPTIWDALIVANAMSSTFTDGHMPKLVSMWFSNISLYNDFIGYGMIDTASLFFVDDRGMEHPCRYSFTEEQDNLCAALSDTFYLECNEMESDDDC